MKAAVIGLGKIGLPLAVQIAGSGVDVVGADVDRAVVESVNAGIAPFVGEPTLAERLGATIASGTLDATTSTPDAVAQADVILVVVPLAVDERGAPAFEGIDGATEEIGGALLPGQTVIYETTLPVGTTRRRFGEILGRASGLAVGRDFFLAFSPERVSSGQVFRDLRSYPKIVGGVGEASTTAAVSFYSRVLDFDDRPDLSDRNGVWDVGSADAAEFVKLAETTYRDVNIALANEFAANAELRGLDIWQILNAANSQPHSHIHRPGIAVGGHCIPIYPRFYLAGHPDAALPAAARAINERQPARMVERLEGLLGDPAGQKIAVLGAAYRGGVRATAYSGVYDVALAVVRRGGRCVVHDPLYTAEEIRSLGFEPYLLGEPIDGAIVQTDHREYRALRPSDLPGCRVLVDGRGILDMSQWERAGVATAVIGVGQPAK